MEATVALEAAMFEPSENLADRTQQITRLTTRTTAPIHKVVVRFHLSISIRSVEAAFLTRRKMFTSNNRKTDGLTKNPHNSVYATDE